MLSIPSARTWRWSTVSFVPRAKKFLPTAPPFLSIYVKIKELFFPIFNFFGGWGWGHVFLWLIADFLLAQGYDTFCHITFLSSSSSSQKSSLRTVFSKMWGHHRNPSLLPPPRRVWFLETGDLQTQLYLIYLPEGQAFCPMREGVGHACFIHLSIFRAGLLLEPYYLLNKSLMNEQWVVRCHDLFISSKNVFRSTVDSKAITQGHQRQFIHRRY